MKLKEIDMRKYYFPLHLDGGNRGCEAIAKGTVEVLGLSKDQYIGWCTNINLDNQLQLGNYTTLIPAQKRTILHKAVTRIGRSINPLSKKAIQHDYAYRYNDFLDMIGENDVCLITGGDMLCYGDNQVNYIVDHVKQKGNKVVLWGCSVGKERLTKDQLRILNEFDIITARESPTYEFLHTELGLKTVQLFPDPAFVIEPKKISLPRYFNNNIFGINISNYVDADKNKVEKFYSIIREIINYLLKETDYTIVLFPHVFWSDQDDRKVCKKMVDYFANDKRVQLFNSEGFTYEEIRYAISKCRFFAGARTHSVISAYTMAIPTIALGYSIKSIGIAKDLSLSEQLVTDYRGLNNSRNLQQRIEYLIENECKIKDQLESEIPFIKSKAFQASTYFYEHI